MDRIETLQLNRLEDEIKKNSRRIETMQKSLDLLYEDRSILEDIVAKLNTLLEQFQLNRNRSEKQTQDIKFEVQEVKDKVEDKIGDVGNTVEKNIGTLVSEMKQKQVVTIKEGFFAKIKKLIKH
jgi:chromosome segregation ATPase